MRDEFGTGAPEVNIIYDSEWQLNTKFSKYNAYRCLIESNEILS
jgi:hypothetical protein